MKITYIIQTMSKEEFDGYLLNNLVKDDAEIVSVTTHCQAGVEEYKTKTTILEKCFGMVMHAAGNIVATMTTSGAEVAELTAATPWDDTASPDDDASSLQSYTTKRKQ
jgi:hypothetical protein